MSNLSISQKAKDNFQDYFDHLIAIQDYAHFDGLVTGTFELIRPWILDQNRQLTCQLMEQQSENNAIAQFFDIIQISRYWPHRSRTSICEYFCNKQPDDIKKCFEYSICDHIQLITSTIILTTNLMKSG